MGLDLVLLPMESESAHYSHSVLNCMRREDLFEVIKEVERKAGYPVNQDFVSFMSREDGKDYHYGETTTTPYGEQLMVVPAFRLKGLHDHMDVKDNHRNQAVWAYLGMLSDGTAVALYWN